MNRKLVLIVLGLLAAYGLYAFLTRADVDEAARVRGAVQGLADAVEAGRPKDFMDGIAATYSDDRRASRTELDGFIKGLLLRYSLKRRLVVRIDRCDVTFPEEQQAAVALEFKVWDRAASSPRTTVAPGDARTVRYRLTLVPEDGRWKVSRADPARNENR